MIFFFGDYTDQRALAQKLCKLHQVSGIVFERRKGSLLKKIGIKIIFEKILRLDRINSYTIRSFRIQMIIFV